MNPNISIQGQTHVSALALYMPYLAIILRRHANDYPYHHNIAS